MKRHIIPTIKKHCSQCGTKLVLKKRKVSMHDASTGEKIYERRYRCPKVKLFLCFSMHDEKIVIEGKDFDGKYRETVLSPMP